MMVVQQKTVEEECREICDKLCESMLAKHRALIAGRKSEQTWRAAQHNYLLLEDERRDILDRLMFKTQ